MNKSLCVLVLALIILSQIGCGTKTQPKIEQSLVNIVKADYSKLKMQADEFNRATVSKDFNKVVDWTHPKYVEQFGGREKILAAIKTGVEEYKAQGIETVSLSIIQSGEAVQVKGQLFSVILNNSTLKTPSGNMVGYIPIVAVSTDGANWKFISGLDQERFNALFPDAADSVVISDISEPSLVEN